MFETEFTHDGDRCTFEVLLRRFELDDAALKPIAGIAQGCALFDGLYEYFRRKRA